MKTRILVLGGGFGGFNVLKNLKRFGCSQDIELSIVSENNYFLFTPMLPEITSCVIHPSDITIPIRNICKNAKFHHAQVMSVDFQNHSVIVRRVFDGNEDVLFYDYLVIALGSKNNFFANSNIEHNTLTIKTLEDSIAIRNHVISMLEDADQECNPELQRQLLTFVIVGGGFAGVEVAGELNDFVIDSVNNFYKNIDIKNIKVILVSSQDGILPEGGKEVGQYAAKCLQKSGIEIIKKTKAIDCGQDYVLLDNNTIIPCTTVIWAAGTTIDPLISSLPCVHDSRNRIIVDRFLRIPSHQNVFVLGDCACIFDFENKPCPPTAQNAIKEAKTVANNIISTIRGDSNLTKFNYNAKGIMAILGKRKALVRYGNFVLIGFMAWAMWRYFYLSNLPTMEKKIRVGFDWFLDFFFKRDVLTVGHIKRKTLSKLNHPIKAVFALNN